LRRRGCGDLTHGSWRPQPRAGKARPDAASKTPSETT
jgi:hypothetical protein